ncbi:MAG: hypothetical protein KKD99_01505 [Proteobacteria bacterium]|nr:hypothetical protein [Pseudomonadota bacterium]MBU4356625.1 hypothetical protein [Pseudomonadota bacterium]MBU4447232.1 hypothetical protein [Pseudomonadota bacterium]MCG2773603.1 hypothetical protein [Desulfobacterales bacterium]
MEANDAIKEIKHALNEVHGEGNEFVHIQSLINFLESLDKSASMSIEMRKTQHESNLEWYKAQRQFEIENYKAKVLSDAEMFKSVIQTGQSALKISFIINGGAAVALLAFIGNIWTKMQGPEVVNDLISSLISFGGGVLLGAIATGITYLTQATFSKNWVKGGNLLNIISIIFVIGAYICFGSGIWFMRNAFITHLIQK